METEERKWRQENAVADGTEALDGMIKSFRFIIEQLERERESWDGVNTMPNSDDFDDAARAVGRIKILSRSAQIASSQLNSTVGQAVMAAAKIAAVSKVEGIHF